MSKYLTIFGNPVSHSISPLIHNHTIKALNETGCYGRMELKNGSKIREKFFELDIFGANITVPFKEDAYMACDEIYGIAKEIKAVNTIIKRENKLLGYNTDAPGFYEMIKEFSDIQNALILGAGGTSKAISSILRQNKIEPTILNRSEKRLEYFKTNGFQTFSWSNFQKNSFDIIINTTSAGLNDNNLPLEEKLLSELIESSKYCIDVIYNKTTPFLKLSKKFNKIHKDGSEMLLYQAVLAFEIFFDHKYSKDDIKKHMRYVFFNLL